MTAATVDISNINRISENESTKYKIDNAVDLDTLVTKEKIANNNYYYSSGSFNFIFDKGFKPETLEEVELTSVPFVPNWHKGILSIHGLIIPVIDIKAFARTQKIEIKESNTSKSYLLKLEHKDHSPIVFMLDSLPVLVNADNLKMTKADHGSPTWLKHYLETESTKIAFIDHKIFFDHMINAQ